MILTQDQLTFENSLRRILPADVVSLWIPDGYNKAKDIIRGNHGQCDGTHPNVPVLPSLINPSVGWWFGGDDYIDLGTPASLNIGSSSFTIGVWLKFTQATESVIFGKYDSHYFRVYFGKPSFRYDAEASPAADTAINDDVWHRSVLVVDKVADTATFYVDGEPDGVADASGMGVIGNQYSRIGSRVGSLFFDGYIALPFLVKGVWSQAQVKNDWRATRGLFAPRG